MMMWWKRHKCHWYRSAGGEQLAPSSTRAGSQRWRTSGKSEGDEDTSGGEYMKMGSSAERGSGAGIEVEVRCGDGNEGCEGCDEGSKRTDVGSGYGGSAGGKGCNAGSKVWHGRMGGNDCNEGNAVDKELMQKELEEWRKKREEAEEKYDEFVRQFMAKHAQKSEEGKAEVAKSVEGKGEGDGVEQWQPSKAKKAKEKTGKKNQRKIGVG